MPGAASLPLVLALGLTGLVCLVVAAVVWSFRHNSRAAGPLALALLATGWWNLAYAAYWTDPSNAGLLTATYLGVLAAPTAVLVFAVRFSGRDQWLTRPVEAALAIEPVVVAVLVMTDAQHGLFYGAGGPPTVGVIRSGGPVFWLNVVYAYAVLILALGFVIARVVDTHGIYRRQATTVLLGLLVPGAANIVMVGADVTIAGADPTPLSMALSSAILAYAVVHYRVLAVQPVARHVLVERMADGVLVLDPYDRVIDANPSAVRLLGLAGPPSLGAPARELLADRPALLAALAQGVEQTEISLSASAPTAGPDSGLGGVSHVEVDVTALADPRGRRIGRLVVLRDVSQRKALEGQLAALAATDPLTGLGNRRRLAEAGDAVLARAHASGGPMAVVLLDLDNLKVLNDEAGHAGGDAALVAVAEVLASTVRETDIVARVGGDEFAILLPDAGIDEASALAERVRATLERRADLGDPALTRPGLRVTVSLGVAQHDGGDGTLDDIIRAADAALYEAKRAGRNRVQPAGASL